jgi:hypothetical protein
VRRFLYPLALGILSYSVFAQEPRTLKYSIASPSTAPQVSVESGSATAGDGNLIVVGAPLDDSGELDAGVVNVFDATTGARLHTIADPYPEAGGRFGAAVAISGSRIAVGAPGGQVGGNAFVYDLASATPTWPIAVLNNPDPDYGQSFGAAVAISGTAIVVGVPEGWFHAWMNVGVAYFYELSTPDFPILVLENPDRFPYEGDYFGISVAISGGYILIGASGDAFGWHETNKGGTAYLYKLSSSTPDIPVADIHNPAVLGSFDGQFGLAVAVSGSKAVIGAPKNGVNGEGAAFVYDFGPGHIPSTPVMTLSRPTPAAGERYGYSVAINGNRVAVGAPFVDGAAADTGRAYVYDNQSGLDGVQNVVQSFACIFCQKA